MYIYTHTYVHMYIYVHMNMYIYIYVCVFIDFLHSAAVLFMTSARCRVALSIVLAWHMLATAKQSLVTLAGCRLAQSGALAGRCRIATHTAKLCIGRRTTISAARGFCGVSSVFFQRPCARFVRMPNLVESSGDDMPQLVRFTAMTYDKTSRRH